MNIESVKTSSQPSQRAPILDASVAAKPAEVKVKAAETAKSTEVSKDINIKEKQSNLSVEDAVKRLADFVSPTQSQISFSIDEESGLRVVKILDNESKEVIRQFPSEEAIALAQALDKIQGLLIKDKA